MANREMGAMIKTRGAYLQNRDWHFFIKWLPAASHRGQANVIV